MNANQVFSKTIKFVWLRLLIGLGVTVGIILWLLLCFAIISAIDNSVATLVIGFIGVLVALGAYKFAMYYVTYLVKTAHVAAVAEICTTGVVPDDVLKFGKDKVKLRFAESNIYYVVDRLVCGAVKQIQKVIGKVGDLLSAVPGMSNVASFAQIFVDMSLGYVDECCLGYSFVHEKEDACKSAADGVVIYFQNWKTLLKSAAISTAINYLILIATTIVLFIVLIAVFSFMEGFGWLVALLVSISIIAAIKDSFVDSYMMTRMMTSFMQVSKTTQITFDLYNKLCNMSNKFKELFNKGQQAQAPVQQNVPTGMVQ